MHLSLSLSLSCPSSTPPLAADSDRLSAPFAGFGTARLHALCSKLPCHARGDVRRPHEVTRDRNSACTHANVRQAHREWTRGEPGGVAGSRRAWHISAHGCSTTYARRGIAGPFRAWRISSRRISSRRVSPAQRVCSSVATTTLIVVSALEEAPARAPTRAGSDIERRGFNPRPRRSTSHTRRPGEVA